VTAWLACVTMSAMGTTRVVGDEFLHSPGPGAKATLSLVRILECAFGWRDPATPRQEQLARYGGLSCRRACLVVAEQALHMANRMRGASLPALCMRNVGLVTPLCIL
jgi:hypothetical protein